jgi:hypothetical protein
MGDPRQPNIRGRPKQVKLLSGGNPQITKADGDAPVQAYIAAMPGWKRDLGKRLDALIVRNVLLPRHVAATGPARCQQGQSALEAARHPISP